MTLEDILWLDVQLYLRFLHLLGDGSSKRFMDSKVASSAIAQSDTRTDRAPAHKKARAIPTTPLALTSPRPL